MKNYTDTDLNNAIEMGLRTCDLYFVAQEDRLCRRALRDFLRAAIDALPRTPQESET